ncbi:hypothetical protein EUX98_g8595 [Antrodiella citrinella]|uniref:Uncharacterized protein n=1 Tax=Antrodiella citrinella TaxID=2447956 RepID=A0A4S4M546_9APHY|nr:hypothetical protein EUX98_g8595 [Antrodiella citrinella]
MSKPAKQLSNGTMGLRFMQNAQRAKQQAQVEHEHAKVQDEAEWEVPQDLKEKWGIGAASSSSQASSSSAGGGNITYEPSYIPFMYDDTENAEAGPSKGRRKFNIHGIEVAPNRVILPVTVVATPAQQDDTKQRVGSISGFQAPLPIKEFPKDKDGKKRTKSVQEIIRETVPTSRPPPPPPSQPPTHPTSSISTSTASSGVAAVASKLASRPPHGSSSVFMKPAGVDDSPTTKRTREHDVAGKEGKKRKKGKESATR